MTAWAPHITGVVLCGGEGRRMGSVEKALLPLRGRPLVSHVLDRMAPQVGSVIVSANRHLEAYRAFGYPIVSDFTPGLGPLGGLVSAASQVRTPWIFCCPGDAPLLDRALVLQLARAIDDATDAVYPNDGERSQYLFLLVRTEICRTLSAYLDRGGRSVHGWLGEITSREVALDGTAASFSNVNSAHDLDLLERESTSTVLPAPD